MSKKNSESTNDASGPRIDQDIDRTRSEMAPRFSEVFEEMMADGSPGRSSEDRARAKTAGEDLSHQRDFEDEPTQAIAFDPWEHTQTVALDAEDLDVVEPQTSLEDRIKGPQAGATQVEATKVLAQRHDFHAENTARVERRKSMKTNVKASTSSTSRSSSNSRSKSKDIDSGGFVQRERTAGRGYFGTTEHADAPWYAWISLGSLFALLCFGLFIGALISGALWWQSQQARSASDVAKAHFASGNRAFAEHDYEAALDYFRRARNLDDTLIETLRAEAAAHVKTGDIAGALVLLEHYQKLGLRDKERQNVDAMVEHYREVLAPK